MTLIIGNEVPGRVIMAADSATGSPQESYVEPHLPKIALCGGDRYLVGTCGSARVGQVLQHFTEWPEPPPKADLLPFLIREVVPEILQSVREACAAERSGELYLGKTTVVLIGVRDELYVLASDLTVVRARGPACIGGGRHAAYPVMEALERAGIAPVRKRIEMTLDIVSRHVPVVEPPFRFLALPAERDDGQVPPARPEQFSSTPASGGRRRGRLRELLSEDPGGIC